MTVLGEHNDIQQYMLLATQAICIHIQVLPYLWHMSVFVRDSYFNPKIWKHKYNQFKLKTPISFTVLSLHCGLFYRLNCILYSTIIVTEFK